MDEASLIRFYFSLGLSNYDIMCVLAINHRIIMSERTLKRRLREMGLYRRKNKSDILDVALYIKEEIDGAGCLNGYRWMHRKCLLKGFVVSRDEVALLMSILDPLGMEFRKKKRLKRRRYYARGPNFLWHVDSYDKLKQYGLCINGCIDGFSRKVLWCTITNSSSNPRIVGGHFMTAVKQLCACPNRVRGDRGTENCYIAKMQTFLTNDNKSFIYGPSTGNQRIESWWRQLRVECIHYWIETLGCLRDTGYFDGSQIDRNLMQYCFMPIIQENINECISTWNTHSIRHQQNQSVPCGRPCLLYVVPSLYGAQDHAIPVEQDAVDVCIDECLLEQNTPADPDLRELFGLVADENRILDTRDPQLAVFRYKRLRELMRDAIFDV